MYEIDRKAELVTIRKGKYAVYSARPDSLILHKDRGGDLKVSRVGDLNDEDLLIALANAVELKQQTPRENS